jgi:hypothetical protein
MVFEHWFFNTNLLIKKPQKRGWCSEEQDRTAVRRGGYESCVRDTW